MSEETEKAIVASILRLFRGDKRRVMQQLSTGRYGVLHRGPLNEQDIKNHIRKDISASIYLLDENAHCSVLCFDIDIPKVEIPSSSEEIQLKKANDFLPIVENLIN